MSTGYSDSLTIDRIENDLGYSPDNCQWLTWEEHARKTKQSPRDKSFKPSKLTDAQVVEVCLLHKSGVPVAQLSTQFLVGGNYIRDLVAGKKRKSVPRPSRDVNVEKFGH